MVRLNKKAAEIARFVSIVGGFLIFIGIAVLPAKAEQPSAQADARILTRLHLVNLMEIQVGELAKVKAQSNQVRDFGVRLAQDHRNADDQVQAVAQQAGIALTDPDTTKKQEAEKQKIVEKLEKAQGADFDKAFTSAMIDGHDQNIDVLKKEHDKLVNPQVKSLVEQTLPVLEAHHQRAQELKQAVPQ